MKGYSELEVFDSGLVTDWRTACSIVDHFPELDREGRLIRCHEVARAVLELLELRSTPPDRTAWVTDGHYSSVEHSWITVGGMANIIAIIDTYVLASLPICQLIKVDQLFGPFRLYSPGPLPRDDIRKDVVDWLISKSLSRLETRDSELRKEMM